MDKLGFKPFPAAVALTIALLIWFVIPVPAGVTPEAWHLLAMFAGVIAAIIGKAMPIGALSIIAIVLVAVTGVTSPKPADAVKDALSSFSSPLIWLIGVSIMISRGILMHKRFQSKFWQMKNWKKSTRSSSVAGVSPMTTTFSQF